MSVIILFVTRVVEREDHIDNQYNAIKVELVMALRQGTSPRNPFDLKYSKRDAIRGNSVDRYNYAVQLTNENNDNAFIKAFAWLSLAADEVDMQEEASRLKHKIGFELKRRYLYDAALKLEAEYRRQYSGEALWGKIKKSHNPINVFLYYSVKLIEGT